MKFKEILHGTAASRDAEQGYSGLKYQIYEFLAAVLVKILMYTPITANQITLLGIVFVYVAAILFGYGTLYLGILAVGFIYLGELMDATDGTLARSKKACSKLQSNILGNLYHSSAYSILFLGIGFGVFVGTGNCIFILLGGISAFFQQTMGLIRFLGSQVMFKNRELLKEKGKENLLDEADEKKLFKVGKKSFKNFFIELIGAPIKHLRLIIIVVLILNYTIYPMAFSIFTIFYAIFIPIKTLGFLHSIYYSFKRIETKN